MYRLHSDRTSDVKIFSTPGNSRAYAVLDGTGWLIVSIHPSTERKLYDYTNGYNGGSNSLVQTHPKVFDSQEIGMFSPEDGRFFYVVSSFVNKALLTVRGDGINTLSQDLSSQFPSIHPPEWIRGSDLCVVGTWSYKFAIVNFMDSNQPYPVYYTLPVTGSGIIRPQVWLNYRAFILPHQE